MGKKYTNKPFHADIQPIFSSVSVSGRGGGGASDRTKERERGREIERTSERARERERQRHMVTPGDGLQYCLKFIYSII